jgi:hypothetical protein
MAESSSFDFEQEFRWSDCRNWDGLDDVLESKSQYDPSKILHATHFSPAVTTLAALIVSGSVDDIESAL